MISAGLEFDPAAHRYTLDGARVPGVTSVMVRALDFGGAPQAALELARQRGSAVHRAVELDLLGTLDDDTVTDMARPYLTQFRVWRHAVAFKPIAAEMRLASRRYGYAGTPDALGTMCDTPPGYVDLIDWKATAAVPITAGPQTAGYAQLVAEMVPGIKVRRWALSLSPRNYRLVSQASPTDWPVFASALTLWRFCHVHGLAAD